MHARSRTVTKDMEKLQEWMKRSTEEKAAATAAAAEPVK